MKLTAVAKENINIGDVVEININSKDGNISIRKYKHNEAWTCKACGKYHFYNWEECQYCDYPHK